VGDLVEADQGEGVAVGVAEAGENASPDGPAFAEQESSIRGTDLLRVGGKLDAAEAGSKLKMHATGRPLAELGEDVVGDEDNAGGTADEFELARVGRGGDEGKHRGAVGRSDGHEAFAGLEPGVVGEMEAEFVEVEAEGRVLTGYVDVDGVDAEVRKWGRGGHGEIIRERKAGRDGEKKTRRWPRKHGGGGGTGETRGKGRGGIGTGDGIGCLLRLWAVCYGLGGGVLG